MVVMASRIIGLLALLRAGLAEEKAAEFDFIVVGGGVAGSIIASRLSESGKHSVLLLNVAGTPPEAYRSPVLLSNEFIVKHNLTANSGLQVKITQPGYSPVKEFSVAETGSSPARWLGGSSLVGLSLYLRDHPEALDAWGEGWGWKDMHKYFHKVESMAETCYGGHKSCGDYGTAGPVHIAKEPAYTAAMTLDFIAAAKAAGLEETRELNTDLGPAVGVPPTMQHDDGTKVHAFDAYLRPAMGRSNLHILHGARADRLIMSGDTCKGVVYRNLATVEDKVVYAKNQVILSSGYVYTPRLLFLSGIGAKEELERVGMPVVHELPAVGKHLTSARYSPMTWSTDRKTLSQMLGQPISQSQFTAEPKAYQSTVQEALARFRSQKAAKASPYSKRSDVVLTFVPAYQALKSAPLQFSFQGEPWPLKTNAYTILVTLGETEAKGEVTFISGAPDVSPVVTHEPLTHADWELAQEAVEFAMKVGNQSVLGGKFMDNGAGRRDAFSALYDGRGSCRMGKDLKDSVVDYELRVHGIKNLRIVDGSVIPQGSPYLALPEVMALAERAADLVLGEEEEVTEKKTPQEASPVVTPAKVESAFSIQMLQKTVGARAALMKMIFAMTVAVQDPQVELIESKDSISGATWPLICFAAVVSFLAFTWAWKIGLRPRNKANLNYEPLLA